MDASAWLMLGVGLLFLLLGFAAMLGSVSGLPRDEGRGPLVFGVGLLLWALARQPALPGREWLSWIGTVCFGTALVLLWRSGRRRPG